jgi:hypothetical protein
MGLIHAHSNKNHKKTSSPLNRETKLLPNLPQEYLQPDTDTTKTQLIPQQKRELRPLHHQQGIVKRFLAILLKAAGWFH